MASAPPPPEHVSDAHFEASAQILNKITDDAGDHSKDPKKSLHVPSNHEHAHSWLKRVFPYDSLESMESAWHMGNYVLDRKTHEKTFEPMSIYVRVGMHTLYYGSEQEKALHWKKTVSLLEEQSKKMGRQYDDPRSVDHIVPFLESFDLQESMSEMKEPDPSKYKNFNDFFAREIKPEARPIAEPDNDLVVSSPADCRLTVFPTIDLATKYWIKGFGFSMAKLLNSESLARDFDQGSIVIARLAPQDYHRWHAPVSGTVESITEIAGAYYTVNPQAINQEGTLDVFCENRRSVMIVKRSTGSRVAVIAVGAMLGMFCSHSFLTHTMLTSFQSAVSNTTQALKSARRFTEDNVLAHSSTAAARSSTCTSTQMCRWMPTWSTTRQRTFARLWSGSAREWVRAPRGVLIDDDTEYRYMIDHYATK